MNKCVPIYTVDYLDDEQLDCCEITFYKSALEVALMHFLYCIDVQKCDRELNDYAEDFSYLGESAASEMLALLAQYYANDSIDDVLSAAIFFLQSVTDNLIAAFRVAANERCGSSSITISKDNLQDFLDKNVLSVESVTKYVSNSQVYTSYCTVSIPTAYLLQSQLDSNGYAKETFSYKTFNAMIQKIVRMHPKSITELRECILQATFKYRVSGVKMIDIIYRMLVKSVIAAFKESGFSDHEDAIGKILRKAVNYNGY